LPEPGPDDALFEVHIDGINGATTGSAFSVGAAGLWMSARHVTEGCRSIYVFTPRARQTATVAYAHAAADLSMVATGTSGRPLEVANLPPRVGDDGYSFGFPGGQLGGAHTRLVGRMRARLDGRMSGAMPALAWAEVERYPSGLNGFAGMSGGPVFDEHGRVVGIHISTWIRRGRLIAVAPEVLRDARGEAKAFAPSDNAAPVVEFELPGLSLKELSEELYRQGRIAYVYCTPP
jgi:S1-C subfamily serine protease